MNIGSVEPAPANDVRWRRVLISGAVIVAIACGWRAISKPFDGDFNLHWEFGRRFLAGEFLYAGGHHVPYPPFWAMAHAPVALLPMAVAKALLFPLGLLALVALVWIVRRLASDAFEMSERQVFWATTLAVVLASRYIIRDLAEVGVNTALVMLSWGAVWLWTLRRDSLAGASLGLAIALKCTPAIFVGYFLWKRQWRAAAASVVAAAVFTIAPIAWQGPAAYWRHIATWSANAWIGFGNPDPTVGVLGPERLQNMSLRPTLARYLTHLPEGHPGRVAHAGYADVLDLSPATAGWVIKAVLIALAGVVLWRARAAVVRRDDPRVLWELAAVSILMLLLSPITWGQHCVALIPACYLVAAQLVSGGRLPRWMLSLLGVYILFVLVLSRDIVGRELSLLLGSYHVETFAIVALLAIVVGSRGLRRSPATSVSAL